jgi:hypothetical protein
VNKQNKALRDILKQIPPDFNISLDQLMLNWVEIVGERIGANRRHVALALDISLTKYRRMIDTGRINAPSPLKVGRPKKNER